MEQIKFYRVLRKHKKRLDSTRKKNKELMFTLCNYEKEAIHWKNEYSMLQ